ncbi:MAG: hypothetical protein K8R88_05175 [Armatimonadetes bacterium]|nr:hypothetical protein [Armatimonadota bacterium]
MVLPIIVGFLLASPAPFDLVEVGVCESTFPLLYRADVAGYGYADRKGASFFDENGKKLKTTFPLTLNQAALYLDKEGHLVSTQKDPRRPRPFAIRDKTFRPAGYRRVMDEPSLVYLTPADDGGRSAIGVSVDGKRIAFIGEAPFASLLWVNELTSSGVYAPCREVVPLVQNVGTAAIMSQFRDLTFISPTVALFVGVIQMQDSEAKVKAWENNLTDFRQYKLSSTLANINRRQWECELFGIDTSNGLTQGIARFKFEFLDVESHGDFGAGTLIPSFDSKWVFLKAGEKVLRLSCASILKHLEWEDR